MKHFAPTHSSFEDFSVKQQAPFRTQARVQWRLILSFRGTEPPPNNFPLFLYFLNDDMSQQIGQWLLGMTFQYRAQFPRLHKGQAPYVRVKSRIHVSYIFNFRQSLKWHPERINVLISPSMFNKPNVALITFIQPWYKALRSSRSSGTIEHGRQRHQRMYLFDCFTHLAPRPSSAAITRLHGIAFLSGPRFFTPVVQNIFFKECCKYCHAIRLAELFVFCVQK